ncbi:MAG TPA: twin-arginine translocase subunit TatC, partial [Vicinamibacterales bacterium]|nr:twin-arginine translocase subunit TatC [Vicinamibacterales bacterium]
LWRNIKYAILIIFIVAAVLTPSSDPWNQTVFAAPMVALYVLSIGVAWIAGRMRPRDVANDSALWKLVVAASLVRRSYRLSSRGTHASNDLCRNPAL